MTRISRVALLLSSLLFTLASSAQQRYLVGTVLDIDEGAGRLQIETDAEPGKRQQIEMDSVATVYHGFGTMIAGKPEIFTGSSGLANVRLGDRVDVRGSYRADNVFKADTVTLLGRTVAAPQVGVGQTRPPTSAATPTSPPEETALRSAGIEGTVRQININEGRIVIQTPQRRMITVRTYRSTPVVYRGETYRIANLEVGDRVRVESDERDPNAEEILARRIEVTLSVQETPTAPSTGGLVTTIDGRVSRVDSGLEEATVTSGRDEIRVDMSQAQDARGSMLRARDLRVGDRVEISGSFDRAGTMFLAGTVRFTDASDSDYDRTDAVRYGVVTISGTVTETLEDAPTITVRDRTLNRDDRIWVSSDFVVRTRANTYVTAETLRVNDTVVIEAFRDPSGNLIAQTIRIRNR